MAGHPARFWTAQDDGRIRCDVCPRGCRISEGGEGICFVRANREGRMELRSYGRSSGFCVDPIEKKPLYHFLPGSSVLSFGGVGCNLTCAFCQNWSISHSRNDDALSEEADPDAIAQAAIQAGCRSVAFTYNEPITFLEYVTDVAEACRRAGVRTVAVTAGYINPEPRREFFRNIDAANVDLKAFSESFYHKFCGARLEPILDTLRYLRHETSVHLEITTLLIPGHNDSEGEIDQLTQWIVENIGPDVPLHFSAFHPDGEMLNVPSTPPQTLSMARKIARKNGIRHCYTGNVRDEEGAATYCHGCGARLIARDGFAISEWNLRAGRCACGTVCAGVFEDAPGNGFGRRHPARIRI